jgi:hypothetical protein
MRYDEQYSRSQRDVAANTAVKGDVRLCPSLTMVSRTIAAGAARAA